MVPSRNLVLSLYRGMLRNAGKFSDYNFRSYTRRRVTNGFRENQHISGEALSAAYSSGLLDAGLIKRQSIVSSMYAEPESVMSGARRS